MGINQLRIVNALMTELCCSLKLYIADSQSQVF